MPRLRRLNGREVITIFERFGFQVIRIRGSHHRMQRIVNGQRQFLSVPVHGRTPLSTSTLHTIYRQASQYISEEDLFPHFYGQ